MTVTEPKKKGLGPLAWIAIGCIGLLVVGGVIAAAGVWWAGKKVKSFAESVSEKPVETAAKAFALVNPEIEFVSADEGQRTVVFRQSKTGKEMSFNFDDIERGRIVFDTGEGEVTINAQAEGESGSLVIQHEGQEVKLGMAGGAENLPAWVPRYPGATVGIGMTTTGAGTAAGMFTIESSDSVDTVIGHFERALAAAGMNPSKQTVSGGGETIVILSATEGERSFSLQVSGGASGTRGTGQYSGQ